jgi:hypothetical protein
MVNNGACCAALPAAAAHAVYHVPPGTLAFSRDVCAYLKLVSAYALQTPILLRKHLSNNP